MYKRQALDGDPGFHEMQLVVRPQGSQLAIDMYLDGQLGATRLFDNWGGLDYHLMLSGMPRASGDSVFAAFDNVQAWAPEPSAWMLAVFGLGALAAAGWWRKRRRPATEAAPL